MNAFLRGYITTENYIEGLTPGQMRAVLGLPPVFLVRGAEVWEITRRPGLAQFADRGSTRKADGVHMNVERELATRFIPGEWWNRRLVKVLDPDRPRWAGDWPDAIGRVAKQWKLLVDLPARRLCSLAPDQAYFRS